MSESLSGGLVLDTDVTSFLFGRDPVRAPRYRRHINNKRLYLPFVVVAEMLFGAEVRNWGEIKRAQLNEFLESHGIVQSDPVICAIWSRVRAHGQQHGRVIERQDAWVAAVALSLDLPLLTHNASDYAHVPLLRIITEPDT